MSNQLKDNLTLFYLKSSWQNENLVIDLYKKLNKHEKLIEIIDLETLIL